MPGKAYYLATYGTWRRHAARFANAHFVVLDARSQPADLSVVQQAARKPEAIAGIADATSIVLLVEGDEGAHLALQDDPTVIALPHPLAQKPIPEGAQTALATHGVAPGSTTFDAAEVLARVHPLLRHRVF